MASKGFYLAQEGHTVNILPPVNITGGVTAQPFALKFYGRASIVIQFGAQAASATKIILNACTTAGGANATAIPFDIFTQETSNADVLSGRTPVSAAGYSPSANPGIFYVAEIDAAQLPQGSPFLQLQITNGSNNVMASAVAVLSASRYQGDSSFSALN